MSNAARTIGLLAICGLAACGDSTGVDDIPDIGGNWTYNLTYSADGSTCTYDPSAVTISQSGGTFTGRIEIPDAICTFEGGDPYSLGSWGADISNGTISAVGIVTFQWGNTDTAYHNGQASGNSMSGSTHTGSLTGTAIGAWSLTR